VNLSDAPLPKTVLVVDDSAVMRRLLSEIVAADPEFRVVDVAENGRVALSKVREHKPDAVLLDIEMPELSGLDTLRRLGLRSPSKVIIVSHLGYEGSRERAEAFRLGAADVIDKPSGSVSMDLVSARGAILNQTLRRVLGLPPGVAAAQGAAKAAEEPAPTSAFDPSALVHVVDVLDTGVLVFDRRARLTYANTAADRALAVSLRGRTFVSVNDVFTGEHGSLASDVREVIATSRAKRPVLATPLGAHDASPPLVSILPLPDGDGGRGGAFVLLDVTSKNTRRGGA
jgi:two-component system chemotaxis response regulator CheB